MCMPMCVPVHVPTYHHAPMALSRTTTATTEATEVTTTAHFCRWVILPLSPDQQREAARRRLKAGPRLERALAFIEASGAREEAEDLGLGQMMNDGQSLTPVGSTSMSNSTGSVGFTGFVGSAGQSLARDDARAAAAWRDEVPEWRTRGGEVCDALREIHYAVVYGSWLPQNVDYGDVTNRILWVVGYVVAAFVCVCARA